VADDAFTLHRNMLKPFSSNLTHEERIFNYHLIRARRIVENSVVLLANRFLLFHTEINMRSEKLTVFLSLHVFFTFLKTAR
jgi:hypothetical protein